MARKLAIALLMFGLGVASWDAIYDIMAASDAPTLTDTRVRTMSGDGTGAPLPPK